MKMYLIDAFAENVFTGNPAAVCDCGEWLPDELMQNIAAENNLPETAFVVKEKDYYRIRWFTPKYEIDLCGHATLASAYMIHNFLDKDRNPIIFYSQSGKLTVHCENDQYTLDFPARPPKAIPPLPELENALGAVVDEFYLSRDIVAVVKDETTVKNLTPDFHRLKSIELGDGVIVTSQGKNYDFVSRCFYPKSGVNEDPVTGSAHCNLIPYWSKRLNKNEMTARQISTRGGTLYCRLEGERVKISGEAVLYSISEVFI